MKISVVVLAHNEEKNILQTINAILDADESSSIDVYIYANGCTDNTIKIVQDFYPSSKNVFIKKIDIASKIHSWNLAFNEVNSDFIIFCDGDVVPDKNAVNKLLSEININLDKIIFTTRLFPLLKLSELEKSLIGILQLPLTHEYLSGGMYIINKSLLVKKFKEVGISDMPIGITGEDYFLELVIGKSNLGISQVKNFYTPPSFEDYIRYLARIKWQSEQMALYSIDSHITNSHSVSIILKRFFKLRNFPYIFVSFPAVICRYIFKLIFKTRIYSAYFKLGPVNKDGENILTKFTRSVSTK